jgi:hypothetical protein
MKTDEIVERLKEWSGLLDEVAFWRTGPGANGEISDRNALETIINRLIEADKMETRSKIATDELGNIAKAKTWNRDYFPEEIDFVEWAKSRARGALQNISAVEAAKAGILAPKIGASNFRDLDSSCDYEGLEES